jgi:carotenoid cleavage dioxygenase-like enzyme
MASQVETLIRAAATKGFEAVAAANRAHLPARDAHPFLSGIHGPMEEELTLTDLEITRSVPPALNGRYLRIGLNPIAAVGLVIDAIADTTDLAIIDACRLEDAPVARVHPPHPVPPGFHGNWHRTTEVQ